MAFNDTYRIDGDAAERIEKTVMSVVSRLEDSFEREDGGAGEGPETPSGEPFCGCWDCVVRETLTLAVGMTLHAQTQGLAEVVDAAGLEAALVISEAESAL